MEIYVINDRTIAISLFIDYCLVLCLTRPIKQLLMLRLRHEKNVGLLPYMDCLRSSTTYLPYISE